MKKIIIFVLCFIFAASIGVLAEPTESETTPTATPAPAAGEMPQGQGGPGGRMGGGGPRGGRGDMPMGEGMEPPQIPEGSNMQPPEMPAGSAQTTDTEGTATENVAPADTENGMAAPAEGGQRPQMPADGITQMPGSENSTGSVEMQMPGGGMGRGGMGGGMMGQMPTDTAPNQETINRGTFAEFVKNYQTPIISLVLLIFAFVFVVFYKRKRY